MSIIAQEEYESASTEEEREKMRTECSVISDWLEEEAGVDSTLQDYSSR